MRLQAAPKEVDSLSYWKETPFPKLLQRCRDHGHLSANPYDRDTYCLRCLRPVKGEEA